MLVEESIAEASQCETKPWSYQGLDTGHPNGPDKDLLSLLLL
jgi:hypothetical protein